MTDHAVVPGEIDLASFPQWKLSDVQRLVGEESALVVSSAHPDVGGLFAVTRGKWEVLDTVPSVGLAFDGNRFARALYSTLGEPASPVDEIAWYDSRGMTRLERIDGAYGLHDVRFDPSDPDALVFVSTGTNTVFRHRTGRPLEVLLRPAAVGDAGHRNCIRHHGGLTYLTAFSTMANRREWNRGGDTDTGVLIEVETQRVVVEGLCRPHSPLRNAANDGWVIANSGRAELIWVSDTGERATLATGGWPQDIIRCGAHLIVGVCSRRGPLAGSHDDSYDSARLLIVDEQSRSIAGVCHLPIPKLYDLLVAPEEKVNGLRIGTATNTVRLMDRSIRGAMAATVDFVDDNGPEDHLGEVSIMHCPPTVVLGDDVTVRVRVVYRGTRRGKTFGDHAMRLGIKWLESGVEERHVFQAILIPDQVLEFEVVLLCPSSTGTHTLELGLLQESVAWFGERATAKVDVVAEPPAAPRANPRSTDVSAGLLDASQRRQRKADDVASVGYWWHSVDLGDGVVTPGVKTPELLAAEWESLALPPLGGKSVLDIGAWDGYFSFAAERHGAARVVAVDDFVWAIKGDLAQKRIAALRAEGAARIDLRGDEELWDFAQTPGKRGFDLCHRHLSSRVEPVVANYMELDPTDFGTFDVVLYLGVLYHEPNPLASMQRLRLLTRGVAVVETSAIHIPGHEDRPLAEFYPDDELDGDATNWWSPNLSALRAMAHAVGFRRTTVTKSHPAAWDDAPAGSPSQLYRLMLHCHVDEA